MMVLVSLSMSGRHFNLSVFQSDITSGHLVMKADRTSRFFFLKRMNSTFFILLLLSFLLTGCTFVQLNEETKKIQHSTILVGKVSSTFAAWNMPVVVAAYTKEKGKRNVVHYAVLHELGPYELFVPKGNYHIVAFGDKNNNLIFDQGEPVGQYVKKEFLAAPAGGVVMDLDIVITKTNAKNVDFPVDFKIPAKKIGPLHTTSPGAIANLDDALYSDKYGEKGFWAPLEFFLNLGGNIYFLEDYDPEKIPILFVHGAAGSPQNWETFFEKIDRSKYQPWFFYYPSGTSLDSMSYLLFWKLLNLQGKYQFKELCITAHSMGGLVVRSFLVNYGYVFPSITNFISISTPWGGEEFAESGVKYSPAVIPAWKDMQPNGQFIQSIYSKKIPASVKHFLFFGHKGNRNLLRPNNDKVVTLASQLDQRSQKEAQSIYGFNEDHKSILASEQVFSQYRAILAAAYEKGCDGNTESANWLNVDYLFDIPEDLPRPLSSLVLRPDNKEGAEIWLYLNSEDSNREYGPFPLGKYEVSLVANGFVPEPSRMQVSITRETVPAVSFKMKPRGVLSGYIVKSTKDAIDAGEFQSLDTSVQILSISLKGNEISRTLVPREKKISYSEHYLSGTDYLENGTFVFYDLPGGEYELIINAKGYEQYSKTYLVNLGEYSNMLDVKLVKKGAGGVANGSEDPVGK